MSECEKGQSFFLTDSKQMSTSSHESEILEPISTPIKILNLDELTI